MTPLTYESCTSVKRVHTERVTVDLETKALYAARVAADMANLSLSEWLGKVAWEQAVAASAQHFAQQERLHPDERPGWLEDAEDRILPEREA
jgi:hypothetical protein